MTSLERTIKRLRSVILDSNCTRMNKSTVVGFLGELIVLQRLEMEGLSVLHKGGQCGYDLLVHGDVTIDVKTSRPRILPGTDVLHWGWALKSASKKRITATHFVCVELAETCEVRCFHVIQSTNLEMFPPSIGAYSGVQHTFQTYERHPKIPKSSPWFPVAVACINARKRLLAQTVRIGHSLKRLLAPAVAVSH